MSIGRMFFVEGVGWVPLINISRSQGKIFFDFFTFINYNRNKDERDKVKCNCVDCCQNLKIDCLKIPKVITLSIDKIQKMSAVVLEIPTNLLDNKEKTNLKYTI